MAWTNGDTVWTRESGTADNPIGEWITSLNGNTYTLKIKEDGTMSLSITNILCDNDNEEWQY